MAGFKELLNRYKTTVETLQKLAECAVCLDTLKTPFKLCTRGHMMCCSCVDSLKACPSCEAEFSIETPIGVRNMLEALPKLCCYSSEGCQDVVESGSDHEIYCGYRPEPCRRSSCGSVVPVCELLMHYQSKHPKRLLITEKVIKIHWPNFNPSNSCSDDILIFLFGCFFWITSINDIKEKQLKMTLQAVPTFKPVKDYYVCVKFENNNFFYYYTLKAFMDKSVQETKKVESDKNVSDESKKGDQELCCMKIPTTELKRLINEDKGIEYSMTFFEEDLE